MIISNRIFISRILGGTWQITIYIALTCVITYALNEFFLKEFFELPAIVPTILGTAISFFIGFNNNQAYDRWWEGRKIWGALVNDSRTWARQVINYTSVSPELNKLELKKLQKRAIHRHIAFLYALKENLRGSDAKDYNNYLIEEESNAIEQKSNKHNAILDYQSVDLEYFYTQGVIDGFRFKELNRMIVSFCNEMGKAERIKNTVFPTTYPYYTKVFIWIFITAITLVTANLVGAWSILIGMTLGYVFTTTHSIGKALLNPFENIITGNPLDQITRTIEINLLESLGEKDIPKPIEVVDEEYIM